MFTVIVCLLVLNANISAFNSCAGSVSLLSSYFIAYMFMWVFFFLSLTKQYGRGEGRKAVFVVWELDLTFTARSRCCCKRVGHLHWSPALSCWSKQSHRTYPQPRSPRSPQNTHQHPLLLNEWHSVFACHKRWRTREEGEGNTPSIAFLGLWMSDVEPCATLPF